jgi:hypothetical protein
VVSAAGEGNGFASSDPRTSANRVVPPFSELAGAHRELMVQYADVLGETTLLRGKDGWRNDGVFTLRIVVRLLAESHVRRKVKELSRAYAQLEQTLSGDRNPRYVDWLVAAQEGCQKLRESLWSWKVASLLAVLPLVGSLGAQIQGIGTDAAVAAFVSI